MESLPLHAGPRQNSEAPPGVQQEIAEPVAELLEQPASAELVTEPEEPAIAEQLPEPTAVPVPETAPETEAAASPAAAPAAEAEFSSDTKKDGSS